MAQLRLNTDNQTVLITRTIEQAPSKNSMLRELVKNSLEAIGNTTFAPKTRNTRKEIRIRKTDPLWFGIGGYSPVKFGVWNTGTGMSASELRKATDLASSINKTQGTKNNFGIGAKVSTLGVNQTGVIWISCQNGIVSLVLLRKAHDPKLNVDAYERMDFPTSEGGTVDVADITHLFNEPCMIGQFEYDSNPSGLTTDEDWTYIVLCGNDVHQNTCEDPYGEKGADKGWALAELYKRFADIPDDVTIHSELHNRGDSQGPTLFKTVEEDLQYHSSKYPEDVQYEGVTDTSGIKIHYYWDGPSGTKGNEKTPTSVVNSYSKTSIFSALKFKNEFFDIRGGSSRRSGQNVQWSPAAKECGIFYGHDYVRVYVEIPNDFDVIQDQYRTRLLIDDASKDELKFTSYASEIYKNIPTWLKDRMNQFAPKPTDLSDVTNELQKYMDELNLRTAASKLGSIGGSKPGGSSTPAQPSKPKKPSAKIKPNFSIAKGQVGLVATPGGSFSVKKKVPRIIALNTDDEINKASVCDTFSYKAAEYVQSSDEDTLFINGTYDAVTSVVDDLLSEHQQNPLLDNLETVAYKIALNAVTHIVGMGLVHGLVKKGTPGYSDDDFEKVIDPAVLTTHADNWKEKILEIRKEFKKSIVHLLKESETAESSDEKLSELFDLVAK
jgi:hypothetical protein